MRRAQVHPALLISSDIGSHSSGLAGLIGDVQIQRATRGPSCLP
jgi:hypothetical protein